jgi:hypothetical protein
VQACVSNLGIEVAWSFRVLCSLCFKLKLLGCHQHFMVRPIGIREPWLTKSLQNRALFRRGLVLNWKKNTITHLQSIFSVKHTSPYRMSSIGRRYEANFVFWLRVAPNDQGHLRVSPTNQRDALPIIAHRLLDCPIAGPSGLSIDRVIISRH